MHGESGKNPNAAAHAAVDKAFSDGGMQAVDMAAALRVKYMRD